MSLYFSNPSRFNSLYRNSGSWLSFEKSIIEKFINKLSTPDYFTRTNSNPFARNGDFFTCG